MTKVALDDLQVPLSHQMMAQLIAHKIGIELLPKIESEEPRTKKPVNSTANYTREDQLVPTNELPDDFLASEEEEKEVEIASVDIPMEHIAFAILPSETTVLTFL